MRAAKALVEGELDALRKQKGDVQQRDQTDANERRNELGEVFRVLDIDGSGSIGIDEMFRLGEKARGADWSLEKAQKRLERLDTSGDGEISHDEFVEFYLEGKMGKANDKQWRAEMKKLNKAAAQVRQQMEAENKEQAVQSESSAESAATNNPADSQDHQGAGQDLWAGHTPPTTPVDSSPRRSRSSSMEELPWCVLGCAGARLLLR